MNRQRSRVWVKICGTTNLRDAQLSAEVGADALGFVFAPSPRQIDTAVAAEIVGALAGEIDTIGVFVKEDPVRVAQIAEQVGLSGVQLHGEETPQQAAQIRQFLGQKKIIKALSAQDLLSNTKVSLEEWLGARDAVDAILLDSGSAQHRGGTGAPFDWEQATPVASAIRERMPLIIAGGLNPENVARAIELFQPWGVDVVSGIESELGRKDATKLRDFVAATRAQAARL